MRESKREIEKDGGSERGREKKTRMKRQSPSSF